MRSLVSAIVLAALAAAPPSTMRRLDRSQVAVAASRDLSKDEADGGHTLARHVGRSDAQLAERLRLEPHISSASTYNDRSSAERVVAAAIASGGNKLTSWQRRSGRRPNLVLSYTSRDRQPIGRSLSRGQRTPVDCFRALVVLRWNERANRYYVLTSYPEALR